MKRRRGWGTRTAEAVALSEAVLLWRASGDFGALRFGLFVDLLFLPFAVRKDGAVAWVAMRGIVGRQNYGDSGLARARSRMTLLGEKARGG